MFNLKITLVTVKPPGNSLAGADCSKLIQALMIILEIFLRFDCQIYHRMLIINSTKPKDHDLTKIYFVKLH